MNAIPDYAWPVIGVMGFLTLLVLTSYLERRQVDPYIEVDPACPHPNAPPIVNLSRYVEHMSDGAMAAGFEFGSMYVQKRYPLITVGGVTWITKDRRTLMSTGSGTVAGIPTTTTCFVSPRRDGTWIVTLDQTGEGDNSGLERIKRVINVPFEKVWAAHLQRISQDPDVDKFPPGRPYELLANRARAKAEFMVRRGTARYRDEKMESWSYSLLASFGAILDFFKQLAVALPQAFRVKRPPIASPALDIPAEPLLTRWESPRSA